MLVDATTEVSQDNFGYVQYFFWLIFPPPFYDEPSSVIKPFMALQLTPFLTFQFVIAICLSLQAL